MIKRWENCKNFGDEIESIVKENNISELVAKILASRGIINNIEVYKFLHPSLEDLYNPFLLNDMDIAVDRIINAYEKKEKITVYGDYDVDGITSIAVLKKFLTELRSRYWTLFTK